MKKLRVTVDGRAFDVTVELPDEPAAAAPRQAAAPAPAALAAVKAPAAPAPAAKPSGGPGDVHSPLAGKVVSIDVKLGDVVVEGAQVATIEAMKMNTYVNASRAGRVAAIKVNPGDAIEEGATVLVIE